MRVDHLPCGAFVNASEEKAYAYIRGKLQSELGGERFLVLTNVAHSVGANAPADEIDIIVLGATGIQVVEVKHWDRSHLRRNKWQVEAEADKLERKTRKVATRLRAKYSKLGRINGKMLLTRQTGSLQSQGIESVRGIGLYSLDDWRELLDLDQPRVLSDDLLDTLAEVITPRAGIPLRGELWRLGNIVELQRLTSPEDRFHRVYRGRHLITQDRVVLHLYDLSASTSPNAVEAAQREFIVLQRLQKSPWLPRIIDSFQDLPNYPGELIFFTIADSDAPTLADRAADFDWTLEDRHTFTINALTALSELHVPPDEPEAGVIHRTITPEVIRVRSDNRPVFADWRLAKVPDRATVSAGARSEFDPEVTAPEVLSGGPAAADRRSDVYALCSCLRRLFVDTEEQQAVSALSVLQRGVADDPETRPSLIAMIDELRHMTRDATGAPPSELEPPSAQHWAEETEIRDDGHSYRVVGRLGSGGIGRTFKVVQLTRDGSEELGTYVAKTVNDRDAGDAALLAHMRVRSHAKHPNLARIYSTASEWRDNIMLALLDWIEGVPLGDYAGVLEIYAEDLGEAAPQVLVLTWLRDLCAALGALHRVGLVHGDVSPGNILVNGADVTLIDYDLVTRHGEVVLGSGTRPFSAPAVCDRRPVHFADDLFALAATIYHSITGREPFLRDGVWAPEKNLGWTDDERARYSMVVRFCDRAIGMAGSETFSDGVAAAAFVESLTASVPAAVATAASLPLGENQVPWLKNILSAYPGSRYGNRETRGLDSDFATRTYVETGLDAALRRDIEAGTVKLVILCGNAGDGKTALLQHLAEALGIERRPSAERMWEARLADGTLVRANLDGAAAWRGRSADDLLDEIFAAFHAGAPRDRLAHLVAVNDGRLLEWVEGYKARHEPTRLTEQIAEALDGIGDALDPHIRLVELNLRSLVGGVSGDGKGISAEWLAQLIDRLVGGEDAVDIWQPCLTCVAQDRCTAWQSAAMLGATDDAMTRNRGHLFVERLTEALQAVHQRNEVHITARELKATLSYVLFGVDWCMDIHAHPEQAPWAVGDLAFDAESPSRQGELLAELARLDPALEAHPRIDRYLAQYGT
jgi:serine/threonine protein kinase